MSCYTLFGGTVVIGLITEPLGFVQDAQDVMVLFDEWLTVLELCSSPRRPSGLVGNLHICLCGSREFDYYQSRICVLSFVTESVGT